MLTIALVVMVIFLFLRSFRATVIPAVAVPLSIVGTFGVMYLLGYSLNNLTLMALTISTGFVVDDAIVMIENIARYLEEGDSPLEAALKGSEQIGFTILSLTVSLIAVLIPLLFMGDIVGRLFREFAVTLAVTILVSAVVSLTLTPMMSAKLLKHTPDSEQGWFYRKSEEFFEYVIARYGTGVRWVLRHQVLTLLVTLATFAPHRLSLHHRAQGLLPRAGYRRAPRHHRRPAGHPSASRLWPSASRPLANVILNDPGTSKACPPSSGSTHSNSTMNEGRIQINLRDKRTALRRAPTTIIRSASARRSPRSTASRPSCSRSRTSPSKTASAAPSTNTRSKTPTPPELATWTDKLVERIQQA